MQKNVIEAALKIIHFCNKTKTTQIMDNSNKNNHTTQRRRFFFIKTNNSIIRINYIVYYINIVQPDNNFQPELISKNSEKKKASHSSSIRN